MKVVDALIRKRFLSCLILVSILSFAVFVSGYPILDEILVGILLGVGILTVRGNIPYRVSIWKHLHFALFVGFAGYMLFQVARSPLIHSDWRMIRWILFYGMMAVLALWTSRIKLAIPNGRQTALIISVGVFVYLVLYLGHGLFTEHIRGISRWEVQGVEWAGTAYAMFPLVVGLPAALICLRDVSWWFRLLGLAVFMAALEAAFFYDSRVAFLVALAFLLLSLLILKPRRTSLLLIPFAVIVIQISLTTGMSVWETVRVYLLMMGRTAADIVKPRESDIDRWLAMKAAWITVRDSWSTLLWGFGKYGHHYALRPALVTLYDQYLPATPVREVIRTTGLAALLVDSGLVGVLLLAGNFGMAILEVLKKARPHIGSGLVLAAAICLSFLWLLVSDIQDIVLLYLAVIPGGIFAMLSRARS